VREVERLVRAGSARPSTKAKPPIEASEDADIRAVESHLEEFLGLPVRIAIDGDKLRSGAVTIRYSTLDQLDLICQRLTGGAI
jgi:ParB family chromosome partitioning protein